MLALGPRGYTPTFGISPLAGRARDNQLAEARSREFEAQLNQVWRLNFLGEMAATTHRSRPDIYPQSGFSECRLGAERSTLARSVKRIRARISHSVITGNTTFSRSGLALERPFIGRTLKTHPDPQRPLLRRSAAGF